MTKEQERAESAVELERQYRDVCARAFEIAAMFERLRIQMPPAIEVFLQSSQASRRMTFTPLPDARIEGVEVK